MLILNSINRGCDVAELLAFVQDHFKTRLDAGLSPVEGCARNVTPGNLN